MKGGGKRGKGGPDRGGNNEKQGGANQPKKGGDKEVKFEFGGASGGAPTFDFGGSNKNAQLLSAAQQGLMPLLQSKMSKLVGQSSGYFESLPTAVQNRIKVLKKLHFDKVEIDAEYKRELAELEKKYKEKYQPLYAKREEIVTGKVEPTEAEIQTAEEEIKKRKKDEDKDKEEKKEGEEGKKEEEKKEEEKKEEEKKEEEKKEEEKKGIPNFWLLALEHNDDVGDMITNKDREALEYLLDIKVSPVEGKPQSFSLDFHFAPNPFFENTVLKKTYHVEFNEMVGDVLLDHIEGTEIEWKTGKNLTVKKITQKVGGGRRGKRGPKKPERTEVVEVPAPSFFNFFSPEAAMGLGGDDDDEDEDDYDDLQGMVEDDYELGLIFKDQIIPNAVMWFTGEAQQDLALAFGEDDDDDEEGEEGGRGNYFEDDEDYKSDEDPDFQPDPNQPQQPECKQQ